MILVRANPQAHSTDIILVLSDVEQMCLERALEMFSFEEPLSFAARVIHPL